MASALRGKKPKSVNTGVKNEPGITTTRMSVTSRNHWHQLFFLRRCIKCLKIDLHDRSIFFTNVCSEWAGGRTGGRAGWADESVEVGIGQTDTELLLLLPMITTHTRSLALKF